MRNTRLKRSLLAAISLLAVLGVGALTHAAGRTARDTSRAAVLPRAIQGRLPLAFVESNSRDPAGFTARGSGYGVSLTATEVVLKLGAAGDPDRSAVVRSTLLDANPAPHVVGVQPLPARVNDLRGANRAKWRTGLRTYAGVRYAQVYPGVDLLYYGSRGQLEYDFIVRPGGEPARIRLAISGARGARLDPMGDLVLSLPGGEMRQRRPVAYQEVDGRRRAVACEYSLRRGETSFSLGAYDPTRTLIIDPIVDWATYIGGTDDAEAAPSAPGSAAASGPGSGLPGRGAGAAADSAGNFYVVGTTENTDFPTQQPFQPGLGGVTDVFVSKFSPTGALLYSTYLGGSGEERGLDVAVNSTGIVVTGWTRSLDFPTRFAGQNNLAGGVDAFVAKLKPAGDDLLFSTYLGGAGDDFGCAAAMNSKGDAFAAGQTASSNFPVANPRQRFRAGGTDGFLSRIDADGSVLIFSTYHGGAGNDRITELALDGAGAPFVCGQTASTNFPVVQGFQTAFRGDNDGFVSRFHPSGAPLLYSTYLGGTANDSVDAVSVDGFGNAYLTGHTNSPDFPTRLPFQKEFKGGTRDGGDAFMTRLAPSGSELGYSTFFGGSGDDLGCGISVDRFGSVTFVGRTASPNFPLRSPVQTEYGGGASDAYLTKFEATGATPVCSTFLGGAGNDFAEAVAVDLAGNGFVVGETYSANFPTTPNAFQPELRGRVDYFTGKIFSASLGTPAPVTTLGISQTQVRVTWKDNSSRETGYQVQRSKDGGRSFWLIGLVSANTTQLVDGTLAANSRVLYRVRGFRNTPNGVEYSEYTPAVWGASLPNPPAAPSNLTATVLSNTQVRLNWGDNSANELGFGIERKPANTTLAFAPIGQVGANIRTFTSTGLAASTAYLFRVRAYNSGGNSAYSNEAPATTAPNPPSAPSALTAAGVSRSAIRLNWSHSGLTENGFKVERSKDGGRTFAQIGTTGANQLSYTDGVLSAGSTYRYRVRAFNLGGNSAYSNIATGTTFR